MSIHLFKRGKSKIWWYRFEFEGRDIRRSTRQTNKDDARRIANAKYREVVNERMLPGRRSKSLTIGGLRDLWLERKAGKLSIDADKARWRPVVDHFGADRKVATIAPDDARAFFSAYAETPTGKFGRPPSPATINHLRTLLRAAFRLITDEYEHQDPLRGIEKLEEKTPGHRDHAFTPDEFSALMEACANPKIRLAFIVCYWCGLRLGEVSVRPRKMDPHDPEKKIEMGLPWEWIDLERGLIALPRGFTKTRKGRRVPVPPPALEALRGWRKTHPKAKYVLDVKAGTIASAFTRLRRRAGVNGVFHATRHTALSRYGDAGANEHMLQAIGGHMTRAQLARYLHAADDPLLEMASKVAQGEEGDD